jgi:hypothetical protein
MPLPPYLKVSWFATEEEAFTVVEGASAATEGVFTIVKGAS